jgi:hypothetical protein
MGLGLLVLGSNKAHQPANATKNVPFKGHPKNCQTRDIEQSPIQGARPQSKGMHRL